MKKEGIRVRQVVNSLTANILRKFPSVQIVDYKILKGFPNGHYLLSDRKLKMTGVALENAFVLSHLKNDE